ncbi:hypothetical protein INR76_06170 [Marixanthomonas sp. SCSIO 43207]|uniref:hypothetical protein n=1 Tax=Marixanthomonas sp. SCSIO 43207 TaxID=2779360 RepID=UPI001CA815C5|nr:hypothetical protein [Marixanthomonas sp. SCSIO 43207]UAB82344.1 hypothetical protein INR76_06170 [Marixanthomonas sp. SCSIO 43207]
MADFKLGDTGGLVQSKIIPKKVTFYLVTSDNLNSVKSKSILSDVFTLLASLMWGAYLSVTISQKITLEPMEKEKVILETLQDVFLYTGILFTILAVVFIIWNFSVLSDIKRNELKLEETENEGN